MAQVAMIGTGRMGAAMAAQLAHAGHQLVLYNRTRARAEAAAQEINAQVVDTAAQAAAAGDVVLCILADDAAVHNTYTGQDGLAAGLRRGAVVLEMSTVAPQTIRALAPLITDAGADLLDAPVSGSVPAVQRGELTVLIGGDAVALNQARQPLESFATQILHLGALGAGATVKLAVNSILFALNQAVAEALVLAEKAGVDRAAAYEVFANSAVAAPFVHYKQAAFLHPESAPVAFALELVAKDQDLIASLAEEVDARMEATSVGRRLVQEATAAGLGHADMSALAQLLRRD